jgi:hypothetical protein
MLISQAALIMRLQNHQQVKDLLGIRKVVPVIMGNLQKKVAAFSSSEESG